MPDDSKRAASSSPKREPNHDVKRLRLSDLWSEEEHLKQDNQVKQLLLGNAGKPRKYDVTSELNMALVLKFVGEVVLEGPNSTLLRAPTEIEYYIGALEDSPDLMKLVGDAYTNRTFKDVRCHCVWCLFVYLSRPYHLKPHFLAIFRKEHAPTESTMPLYHITATYGQEKGATTNKDRKSQSILIVCSSCRRFLGTRVLWRRSTSPVVTHRGTLQPQRHPHICSLRRHRSIIRNGKVEDSR